MMNMRWCPEDRRHDKEEKRVNVGKLLNEDSGTMA